MMRARVAILGTVVALGCASRAHLARTQQAGEELRVELAETYVQRGAYDAAIPLLRRALAERPRSARLRTLYGTVLRERGLYPQAERELEEAIRVAPEHAPAWGAKGVLYDLMRRPGDAERAHRRAIALAPAHAPYWNNLGFSLYVAGRLDDAVAALERALALDPSLAVAYNNLGFAYGRRGEYDAAARSFRTAGGEAIALYNLSLVHELNGDDAGAAELRARAIAADPDLLEVSP